MGIFGRARERQQQREIELAAIMADAAHRLSMANQSIPQVAVPAFRRGLEEFRGSDGVFKIDGWGFFEVHLASIVPTHLSKVDARLNKLPVWSAEGSVRAVAPWLVEVVGDQAAITGMSRERFAAILAGAAERWSDGIAVQAAGAIPARFHDYVRVREAMSPDQLHRHDTELELLRASREVAFQLAHAYQLLATGRTSEPIVY